MRPRNHTIKQLKAFEQPICEVAHWLQGRKYYCSAKAWQKEVLTRHFNGFPGRQSPTPKSQEVDFTPLHDY